MIKNKVFISTLQIIIFAVIITTSLDFYNLLLAADDPFQAIENNMSKTIKTIKAIILILGGVGLAIYGGYAMITGNFDKARLITILVGIIIVAGSTMLVDFIAGWVA